MRHGNLRGTAHCALVALLADSALPIGEALRLRIEDVGFAVRTLNVRAGKGRKDGIGFFGAEASQHVRAYLAQRREAQPEGFLFIDRQGRSLTRYTALKVMHRLSERTGGTSTDARRARFWPAQASFSSSIPQYRVGASIERL